VSEVAKKLAISETTVREWVEKIQPETAKPADKPLTESERMEL